ncbi:MAG: PDZ domain-containing protein [Verrucomicrobiales bacterium]|nr:PDZ domain-containing protein [Verrucomicrobiales bacterium]
MNRQQIPSTLAAITLATFTGTANAQKQPATDSPTPPDIEQTIKTPATEKEAYIGVHMSRPNPIVASQLGLDDGIGIVVEAVQDDSPAANAGIQRYDILTKLEDQLLVQPEQFATLVRRYSPGDKVKMTLLRHAKEKTVNVTLGSRAKPQDLSALGSASGFGGPTGGMTTIPGSIFGFGGGNSAGDQLDLSQSIEAIKKALGDNYSVELADQIKKSLHQSLRLFDDLDLELAEEVETDTVEAHSDDGSTASETSSLSISNSTTVVKTDDGTTLTVVGKNGKKTLTVTDKNNTTVFEGPYNSKADRLKVPEQIREKLKVLDNVKVNVHHR